MESIVEVRNLAANYEGVNVLEDVSFSIPRGEVTVVLGASGSGKSTILRHILGLQPVQSGVIHVLGRNISELTEAEQLDLYLQMGVFYQNGALLNSMTVSENIALPLQQHTRLPEDLIDDIVKMKLGLVNLLHAKDYFPSQLSGGMLKRAALARAIVMDPPVVFFDEPGAGLDPLSLAALDTLIINLKNLLGMTIVMVTHEVSSIMRIADNIVFIHQGRVAYEGSLQNALKNKVEVVEEFFHVAGSLPG
jgi:phospholipid/cholesterol/gamma-HCH transport system ATP-binding protein